MMLTSILARLNLSFISQFICAVSVSIFLAQPSYAESEIKIAFNNARTPYSVEKTENGIEVEIVRKALQNAGFKLVPVFGSPERKESLFEQKMVDGIATVNKNSAISANYSAPYVTFQNVAITLKSRDLSIRNLNDLKGLKISAFKGATYYLGDSFRHFAESDPLYSEENQQLNQRRLLNEGKVDVIILDRTIFKYVNQMLGNSIFGGSLPSTEIHPIFPKTPYRIGFHNAALRDKFNAGLKKLSKDDIEAIYARYQDAVRFTP